MKNISMRDAFFVRLYELARKDKNVILISADMGAPSLDKFRRDLASQFINVGIAEENMVVVATGLALSGKKVFIYAIMPFVTSRCFEMLKVNLSLMNISVTAIAVGAGFSYDDSGPTHHCTEDIAIMRVLPNMTIFSPSDSIMAAEFAEIAYRTKGPSYVRLDREILTPIHKKSDDFSLGLASLRKGEKVAIISTGNMVHTALKVCDRLAGYSVDASVIDLYRIKPTNQKLLLEKIKSVETVVTLEEHLICGGIGSIVAEVFADNRITIPLKRFGIKDRYYYAYGGRKNIQSICGLDTGNITKGILDMLNVRKYKSG